MVDGVHESFAFFKTALIVNCAKSIILIICFFLVCKKPKTSQLISISVLLFVFFGLIEIFKQNREIMTPQKGFLYGISTEAIGFSPLIVRLSWPQITGLALIYHLYILFRFFELTTSEHSNFHPILISLCNFFFIAFTSYIKERYERKIFFLIKKKENSQRNFQEVIENIVPVGVLICEQERVLFTNQEFLRIFKMQDSFFQNLKEIQEISVSDSTNSSSKEDRESNLNCDSFLPNFDTFKTMSLSELVNTSNNCIPKGSKNFKGKLLKSGTETLETYINIKVSDIIWQDKRAKIIFFTEDPSFLKISLLHQREKEKGMFLASISHELRTPLNSIIGMVKSVQENLAQEGEPFESLGLALSSSYHLLYQINEILDYVQLYAGKLNLNLGNFFVEDFMQSISEEARAVADQKTLKFSLEAKNTGSQISTTFRNDSSRLKQILMNLIRNSAKFTQTGFIKLKYEVIYNDDEIREEHKLFPWRKKLVCSVEDSGQGIKKQNINKIFRIFGKNEESGNQVFNITGLGLGLTFSRDLLRKMNEPWKVDDEFTISSEFGKGSCFSFEIYSYELSEHEKSENQSVGDEPEAIGISKHEKTFRCLRNLNKGYSKYSATDFEPLVNSNKRHKTIRILVVDDDKLNLIVATRYLSHYSDIEFQTASNGEEAINIIKSAALREAESFFSLVLMDCNMPVMDGYMATESIVKMIIEKEIPELPVVAITANVLPGDLKRCLECGMKEFLTKPFTREEMKKKIDLYVT